MTRICPHCQQEKSLDAYYKRSNGKPQSWCKQCMINRSYVNGTGSGLKKLTTDQVIKMRQLREANGYSDRKLAREFGISHQHANLIVNGVYWKHI